MVVRGRAVVGILAALVVAGCGNSGNGSGGSSAPTVGTPADLLVAIPTTTPKPSWTIKLADVVHAPDLKQGILPGSVDDRAFALAYPARPDPAGPGTSWVYSFNPRTGAVLFSGVELSGSVAGCYINGPDQLTCLGRQNAAAADSHPWAWVLDSHSGKVTYNGPTDVVNGDTMSVYKVGQYPVVALPGTGWYGIGPSGEKTWFVPGSGKASDDTFWSRDIPPQRLVVGDRPDGTYLVYSVSDGAVIVDKLTARPWVYDGGYAVPGRSASDPEGRITFYDNTGKELSHFTVGAGRGAWQVISRGALLVVQYGDPKAPDQMRWLVFDATGKKIADLPTQGEPSKTRALIIGDKMYVSDTVGIENTAKENPWKQIDLATASILRTCADLNLRGYVASDGKTILSGTMGGTGHITENAIDPSSCQTLWSNDSRDGGVVKVNTSLVQYSDSQLNGVEG